MIFFKNLWHRFLVILGIIPPIKNHKIKSKKKPIQQNIKNDDLEKENNPHWFSPFSPEKEINKQENNAEKSNSTNKGQAR